MHAVMTFLAVLSFGALQKTPEPEKAFWDAAKQGRLADVKAHLDAGVKVDAKTQFGATALYFAATAGHADVCRLLLERGATVDVRDTAYGFTPIGMAAWKGRAGAVKVLMEAGSTQVIGAAFAAAGNGHVDVVRTIVEARELPPNMMMQLYQTAASSDRDEVAAYLVGKGVKPPEKKAPPRVAVDEGVLRSYVGIYEAVDDGGQRYLIDFKEGTLSIGATPATLARMYAIDTSTFGIVDDETTRIRFQRDASGKVTGYTVGEGETRRERRRVGDLALAEAPKPVAARGERAAVRKAEPWPSFRGRLSRGIADGQHPPITWDLATGKHVRWKADLPGLGHASPVIWGDRVWVTTTIGHPDATIRQGDMGWIDAVSESVEHEWKVLCFDLKTGAPVWERTAHKGEPRRGRHWKASHANCTPAVDGRHVVTFFGSEGLCCFDTEGRLLWKKDLGILDAGWYIDDTFSWGFASSPIIHEGRVIVQCDTSGDSFVAAFDVATGRELWRTARDEIPSWCTPTIHEGASRKELIVSATGAIRGYDPATGRELWQLRGNSHITVASPVSAGGLIYATGGYQPIKPIYAVREGANGDLTPAEGADHGGYLAWSYRTGGVYQCTPLAYRDRLYLCADNGTLSCYDAQSGERLYRQRIGTGSSYTASPVAADGHIYLTSEDGDVTVIKAGPEYERIAENRIDGVCLATPAISDGTIVFRTTKNLVAVAR